MSFKWFLGPALLVDFSVNDAFLPMSLHAPRY